ncbi:urease accessory protein UreD [Streptomyces sp. V4-01]|uniref:Urease accessory protein UreD n=1 Tax=Actinacidiphila polyblastidii TaxID=3110430 RepID=A0ABU7PEX5_9ACTN|nr:urease accessory protein UreD [Streptomyces sp. V4-01]
MGALSGVRATARVRAVADPPRGTVLPLLAGDGPLALRRTRAAGPGAAVTVVGAMSAPLGGDRLRIEAEVGSGARLTVGSAAATVSLPGRDGEPAAYEVHLSVGEGGVLHWLPEPVIAARGSDLLLTTTVELAPTARLVLREEQILGRHGETPGRLTTRLTVRLGGRPLLTQELSFGPGATPGWDGPACLGGHRAVGQLLLVAPEFADSAPLLLGSDPRHGQAVRTALPGPAAVVTALAPDGRRLRALLDSALGAEHDPPRSGPAAASDAPSSSRFDEESPTRPVHSRHTGERIRTSSL